MGAVIASDGLIARQSGPWAEEKLGHVGDYMGIFTGGMVKQWNGALTFLDLMAGPGRCIDRDTLREFPGSPIRALRTRKAFRSVVCVEADDDCADALKRRVQAEPRGTSVLVIRGDANDPAVIDQLRQHADKALSFAFIDLIGQEIAFETVRRLTADRSIDLMFSFPEMDLQRNSPLARANDAERWTRFFGTDRWRPIVQGRKYTRLPKLRQLYEEQLATLGYLTAAKRNPMTNSKGRSIYRLLFASRHQRGIDFFMKTSTLDARGQRPLDL